MFQLFTHYVRACVCVLFLGRSDGVQGYRSIKQDVVIAAEDRLIHILMVAGKTG